MITEQVNRRKFARIDFEKQVKIDFVDESYYSKVKNLSLSGIFIIGNFQEHEGKYCLIDVYQDGESTDLSMRASARVVRRDNKGIALEFVSMPQDSYMFLLSTLPEPDHYPCDIPQDQSIPSETNICYYN